MGKYALTEVMMRGSLGLLESEGKPKRPGVIGSIFGPCADYKNKTRNGNFYSRRLWENAFKDPIVQESLEDRVLLGELDHPLSGRLETQAANACIVMTGYQFNDSKGLLEGYFDILDTPSGRILRTLLDAGCKIGVSSRGEGDVRTQGDRDVVDEDSYTFVGFDAVVMPAVRAAKPTLQESFKHTSLKESLKKEIEQATTTYELSVLEKVIKATNLPDTDSLLESVENKVKELDRPTESSNLLGDLETASGEIAKLKKEIKSLKENLTTCKTRTGELLESRKELAVAVSKRNQMNDVLKTRCSSMTAQAASLNSEISKLRESLDTSSALVDKLKSQASVYKKEALDAKSQLSKEVASLKESLTDSQKETSKVLKEAKLLKKSYEEKLTSEKNRHEKELSAVKESASKTIEDISDKLTKLTEANALLEKEKADLVGSAKRAEEESSAAHQKETEENAKAYQELLREYVLVKSQISGIDATSILESITSGKKGGLTSVREVNSLVESLRDRYDRYRSLPLTEAGLLVPSSMKVQGAVSKDEQRLTQELRDAEGFMERAIRQM